MKMPAEIPLTMIAACGINCAVCYAHLRRKKPCPGCRGLDGDKPRYCQTCKMAVCAREQGLAMCAGCAKFPCARLKDLNKRYSLKYRTNLIENGLRLQAVGAGQFLAEQRERFTCLACGGVVTMHGWTCSECGQAVE